MKASFEALSANVMSSDMLKFFVETATAVLNLANGITNVVDAVGGLKTVLIAVAGIVATMKADALITLVTTKLPNGIKN